MFRVTSTIAAALAAATMYYGCAANAAEFYLEGFVGGPIPQPFTANVAGGIGPGVYTPDPGFGVGGAVGAYIMPRLRGDLSVLHVWAGNGNVLLGGVGAPIPHTGTVSATTILGNVYYEFNEKRWTPWVGAGIGATIFNYNALGATAGLFSYTGSATAFSAAAHLGLDFAATKNLDITGRYSLSYTGGHTIESAPAGFAMTAPSQINNVFLLGLRVKFGGRN